MPTGYTAKIHDGKEVKVKDFIMDCSRAFGALVMMRDQSMDAPIPERFEPNDYARKKAEECWMGLSRVMALSKTEALELMEKEYQDQISTQRKYYEDALALAARYNDMIEQVQLWNPPTEEHEGLKDFCLKQLRDSLDFDCSRAYKPFEMPQKPVLDAWLTGRIERLNQEIKYYEKSQCEEVERTEKRNEWLKQLLESLYGLPQAIGTNE